MNARPHLSPRLHRLAPRATAVASLGLALLLAPALASGQCRDVENEHRYHESPVSDDRLGAAVAINESWVVLGIPGRDVTANDTGAIRIYPRGSVIPTYESHGLATADSRVGTTLAIDGHTVVAGLPDTAPGLVQVYQYYEQFDQWYRTTSFGLNHNFQLGSRFGTGVAIQGQVLAGGAPHHDQEGEEAGIAAVFRYTSGWTVEQDLVAGDAQPFDWFGSAMGLSGPVMAVGAPGSDDFDSLENGAVYVFRDSGAGWVEEQKLTVAVPSDEALFGSTLALQGDLLVAGAPGRNNETGAAYVFRYDGVAWVEDQILLPPGASDGDRVGCSVAIDGDVIIVGAENAAGLAGRVYQYRDNGVFWGLQQELRADNPGETLGACVAIHGDTVVAGAPGLDHLHPGTGGAYWFDVPDVSTCIDPDLVPFGETVEWNTAGGAANAPVMLAIVAANGLPLTLPVYLGTLNHGGRLNLLVPHTDPAASGHQVEVQAITLDQHGKVIFSNSESVEMQ